MTAAFLALAIRISFADVPPALREEIAPAAEGFDELIGRIERDTARRVGEGEWDHLVYYVLQGRQFTRLAPVEPALSAREFIRTSAIPEAVLARFGDFSRAIESPAGARLRWAAAMRPTRERFAAEYSRAMRWLEAKEFASRKYDGAARREFVARQYQERGHSTDTAPSSVEPLRIGLEVIGELFPRESLRTALVAGPGLDIAPRTALDDSVEPRSYQTAFLASRFETVCADVNPRVVQALGCEPLNIVTGRLDRRFDVIVVTNVLLYLSEAELALAMVNFRAMLRPGGFLIHNETRDAVERLGRAVGLELFHARMIRAGGTDARPLYDTVAIHRAGPR